MNGVLNGATLAAAVGAGAAGGVFVAFSTFVMPALGDLPPSRGTAAMQSVNRAAMTPLFMALLFGTAALSAGLAVAGARAWGEPHAWRLLAGAGLYLAGVIGTTIAFHVPRNDALAAVDPSSAEAPARWASYLSEWTAGNHVRAIAGLAAALAFADALRAG